MPPTQTLFLPPAPSSTQAVVPGRHSPMARPQGTEGTSSFLPLQSSSSPLHTSGLAWHSQDMFSSTRPLQFSSAQSAAVGARQPGAAPHTSVWGAPGTSSLAGQTPAGSAEQTTPEPSA